MPMALEIKRGEYEAQPNHTSINSILVTELSMAISNPYIRQW